MELIKKQMKTKDAQGWYLSCDETKSWTEDFLDDDTGEPVSVERTEVLLKKGVCLTAVDISTLLENGITNVYVSNFPLKGYKQETMNLWETNLKIGTRKGDKKNTYIVTAESPTSAETFISNYLEVNVECTFEAVKVSKLEYNRVIKLYDTEREEYERDGKRFVKWYKSQIFAMIESDDAETGSNPVQNVLVQATDFETALKAIKTVMRRNEYGAIYNAFKSMQELNIVDVFIPDESVSYYSNSELK